MTLSIVLTNLEDVAPNQVRSPDHVALLRRSRTSSESQVVAGWSESQSARALSNRKNFIKNWRFLQYFSKDSQEKNKLNDHKYRCGFKQLFLLFVVIYALYVKFICCSSTCDETRTVWIGLDLQVCTTVTRVRCVKITR